MVSENENKRKFLKKYKLSAYNFTLVVIIIVTCAIALAVVNSADAASLKKQAVGMAISFVMMLILSVIDYKWILKYSWVWYGAGLIMLLIVKVAGKSVNGAKRWLVIGSYTIQPSELVKVILIVFCARFLYVNRERLNNWKFLIIYAAIVAVPVLLIIMEPDLSTTIMVAAIIIVITF